MHVLLELYDYTEFPIIGELLGRFAVLDNDGRKNALEYMNFLKSIGEFPATKGKFYKTIVAGHVGTGSWSLADNRNYHDVFYDGESHYYIDCLVYIGGKLLLLVYNEENGKYYCICSVCTGQGGKYDTWRRYHKKRRQYQNYYDY